MKSKLSFNPANSSFLHTSTDQIVITKDGSTLNLSLEDFLKFEPEYSLPLNSIGRVYFPGNYHHVLFDNKSLPSMNMGNDWSDGNRFIQRIDDFRVLVESDSDEVYESSSRVIEHQKNVDPKFARKLEYPRINELVVALWEKLMENNPGPAQELQTLREQVKKKYPIKAPSKKKSK